MYIITFIANKMLSSFNAASVRLMLADTNQHKYNNIFAVILHTVRIEDDSSVFLFVAMRACKALPSTHISKLVGSFGSLVFHVSVTSTPLVP